VGQLLGAIGGALVLRACFGLEAGLGATVPGKRLAPFRVHSWGSAAGVAQD
jgi:hypothetical protein